MLWPSAVWMVFYDNEKDELWLQLWSDNNINSLSVCSNKTQLNSGGSLQNMTRFDYTYIIYYPLFDS